MRSQKHRKDVEQAFREAVRTDRARSKILRISRFGVVEMTRQRMRPSLQLSTYLACPHCAGAGYVKSHESLALEFIRLLNLAGSKDHLRRIELEVGPQHPQPVDANVCLGLVPVDVALLRFRNRGARSVVYDNRRPLIRAAFAA